MPSAGEIRDQVARESERRSRLAVPAFAGGVLYLLSAIIVEAVLRGGPTVGLIQGLGPALSGVANPTVSPRANWVKYVSHHAFGLIAGGVLAAVAIGALTLVLLLLLEATRFRRPETWSAARPLLLVGGIGLMVVNVAHQLATAIGSHRFATGHDFSNHAVDQALTGDAAHVAIGYLALLVGLAMTAAMIATMVNALRVGLVPRWMGVLGMFAALLIFVPIGGATLQVIPAFWLVMTGILFLGRWPGGQPPAWDAGQARPWPSPASARAAGRQDGETAAPVSEPEPVAPVTAGSASRKRRRKRGAR